MDHIDDRLAVGVQSPAESSAIAARVRAYAALRPAVTPQLGLLRFQIALVVYSPHFFRFRWSLMRTDQPPTKWAVAVPSSRTARICWICGRPLSLQSCKKDEHGNSVHDQCYAAKLALDKQTPESCKAPSKYGLRAIKEQGRRVEGAANKDFVLITNPEPKIAEVTRSISGQIKTPKLRLIRIKE